MNKVTAKLEELFGMDIRALALMRIAFSICTLIHLSDLLPYIKMFYTDQGVFPRTYAIHHLKYGVICLNLISGSWGYQALLFLLTAIFTIGLLLGWRTRLCTLMVWILLSSIHNRNYFVLDAGDKMLHILFFWFIFLPWGECYSLDSRRKTHPPPLRVSSMGTVAYLLQVSFFYTFAGFLKTAPPWTTQGTAIYYALNVDVFGKPLGHVLLQYPLLIHYMTFCILWLERYGALFFFIPFKNTYFRLTAIAAFMLFHIGILLSMELRLFQWICLIMLVGFLPTPFLNKILGDFALKPGTPPQEHRFTWKPNLFYMPPYLSLLIAFFLVYVFFWNMGELKKPPFRIPLQIRWIGQTFNLYQHWGMFAPRPMRDSGWYVMPGRLRNRKVVDIFNSGEPVTWKEPAPILESGKIYNLDMFYVNTRRQKNFYYPKPWAEYLCREWNSTHPFDQQLLSLDIYFMEKDTLPNYQKSVPLPILLISHKCLKDKAPAI